MGQYNSLSLLNNFNGDGNLAGSNMSKYIFDLNKIQIRLFHETIHMFLFQADVYHKVLCLHQIKMNIIHP